MSLVLFLCYYKLKRDVSLHPKILVTSMSTNSYSFLVRIKSRVAVPYCFFTYFQGKWCFHRYQDQWSSSLVLSHLAPNFLILGRKYYLCPQVDKVARQILSLNTLDHRTSLALYPNVYHHAVANFMQVYISLLLVPPLLKNLVLLNTTCIYITIFQMKFPLPMRVHDFW